MTEEFEERLVQLKQHDRFFLFSDGVSESCQPSPDLPLVRQAARQLLVGHALPLNDHIHGFVEDARQRSRDDILLVGGEVTGTM